MHAHVRGKLGLALGLLVHASPVEAASYNERVVGDGILAEFESDLNPAGVLGDDIWGWCFSFDEPNISPFSEPGQGTNYRVFIECEEGRVCVDGACSDHAWTDSPCSVEAFAATGNVYWEPTTITRGGTNHNGFSIDFNFNALSYMGSC